MPRLFLSVFFSILLLLFNGCQKHHQSSKMASSAQSMPDFRTSEQLNNWIESRHRKGTRVRIPIVACPKGLLAPIQTFLNIQLPDSTPVQIDDGGLGISYAERIRQYCPDTDRCSLWLEGVWGELVGSELRTTEGVPIFAVLKVEPID